MLSLSPAELIANAIVLLLAVVVHEYAHARVAFEMGDPTAKEQNRMTLDPRANVWWPGYFIGVFIGFAILGSAPVNPSRMRNPRWGMFFAVLAGPVSNLILALLFAIPFWFIASLEPTFTSARTGLFFWLPSPAFLLTRMIFLNILLFIFNLLPLFPLDGWTVAFAAFPPDTANWWERNRQTTSIILGGLVLLSFFPIAGFDPLGVLLLQPSIQIMQLLLTGFGLFA
ncbi:MAG: site-2 protease family protein [Chloroflexi bacterium]|nr:site-2 protease family protein [Chloroflexota bacterium]